MTRNSFHILIFPIFVILVIFQGCSHSRQTTSEEGLAKNIEYLINEGNRLWAQRNDPEMVTKARTLLTAAYRQQPDDLELSILLSRIYYFQSHYLTEDIAIQDSLYLLGKSIAEDGLRLSLNYELTDSISIQEMVKNTDPTHIGALYWWAANFGSYLLTKPVMVRMEHREGFEEILHHMLLINPNYFYGGPYRLFGVLYARIPGVDISRAESYFDQAISAYPDYFASKVLKAQFFYTKAGQREQFNRALNDIISADPTIIPEVMSENIFEQKLAKILLAEESMLFE
ncbi:MAG: hypothetical protein HQ509_12590 [Candidatus Marinimicrobia bacterium]|nr:hypothetical protein [Candidatus Neomarinimicrobiota bacterium]